MSPNDQRAGHIGVGLGAARVKNFIPDARRVYDVPFSVGDVVVAHHPRRICRHIHLLAVVCPGPQLQRTMLQGLIHISNKTREVNVS